MPRSCIAEMFPSSVGTASLTRAVPAADTPVREGVTGEAGTIDSPDGTKQLTLNGMPLYYFAQDAKPGDVTGQGVNDVWYVVTPAGEMIK
ncbi:COG4315 family predicted lipoprotein [Paeniglutamicibacter gangotriensis]|uniref:Uncharacterized protein n=1 Tax=Paeniglutamicibacter gangotriensis Lz1y TaxID=1276920 RepID=M7NCH1_9MICC|nr:Secreted repeat of unknown function [Paeniglutamicibacter gangotriensis Lz1y]